MSRKKQLYHIIDAQKPQTIVEVGTWNGVNAISMASIALKHHNSVHYYGFDLFEDMCNDEDELNVKEHSNFATVTALLNEFNASHPGFEFTLYKGNTRHTLHQDGPWRNADFAFIDGGHSIETIRNDYEALKNCKTIVFDDYYVPDEKGNSVDTNKFGCNKLVTEIQSVMLPMADECVIGGKVAMAVSPPNHCPYPIQLKVETRNCVQDMQIQANVKYSTTIHNTWTPCCDLHNNVAVMISAGDSYLDHLDTLRECSKLPDHYLFCVKSNHNRLIQEGIIPFGCVILDPRPKVKRFITAPHPDVKYFVSSIAHPSTIDLLRNNNLYLYNASVGAGELSYMQTCSQDVRSKRVLGGGSTAASRAIPLLRLMGFYRMKLFGYDSCYRSPQDQNATTKDGQKKFWQVEKYGKSFWTSLELLAQVQDFERYFEGIIGDPSFEVEFYGDGIIPHIYDKMRLEREQFDHVFCLNQA